MLQNGILDDIAKDEGNNKKILKGKKINQIREQNFFLGINLNNIFKNIL